VGGTYRHEYDNPAITFSESRFPKSYYSNTAFYYDDSLFFYMNALLCPSVLEVGSLCVTEPQACLLTYSVVQDII